jgi:hypothetical protein
LPALHRRLGILRRQQCVAFAVPAGFAAFFRQANGGF